MGRIELHTHLEGSVTPDRLIELARRHGQPGVPLACLDPDTGAYRFQGFHGFLDLYKNVTLLLRTPADFHAVTLDLGRQLAADEVSYAEVIVSFGVLQVRDIDPLPVQQAIWEAAQQVHESSGVTMRFVPDAVRQFGLKKAIGAWEAAARCGRAMGAEGAESVRQAVEDCGATRIGHGLAAADDPRVMSLLQARGTFVEMCPRSNVRTGAIARLSDHPLRAFLDAGIPCCLNTDDRTLFDLDLAGEYAAARDAFQLTDAEISLMERQAARAAFGDLP
jgi:aminodeoxyfutalosine deaminase